jgi:lysophospholipase L1-like esterase
VVPSPPDLSACPNGRGPFGDPTSVGLPASFGLDCPSNSWSTGTNPQVNSLYQRILARNPAIAGNVANWATTAVSVSDLVRQAGLAAGQGAELVTVNIGINDACAPLGSNGGQQTPLDSFRSQFEQAMSVLAAAPAKPRILVATIPNANRTRILFQDDPNAQVRWQFGVICPPLLNNPTSTAPADVARRTAFLARIGAYNLIEAQVCAKTPRCQTDGSALFTWQFGRDDIATVTNTGGVNAFPFNLPVLTPVGPGAIPNSTGDYWHATVRGQATIAQRVWNAAKLGG